VIAAVVFDMDGLLIDSEQVWDDVRENLAHERGGRWHPGAQRAMMGMSSPEWSRYMHDSIGLGESPEEINRIVVERMVERYADGPPWIDGALDAVHRVAGLYTVGLASSSNRELIDLVLGISELACHFRATVSSEEVERGKPAPDVYLEATRRLSVTPSCCVAIEDSQNGILSAVAAGIGVIAIPNRSYPPGEDALSKADLVLSGLHDLTTEAVERVDPRG